MQTCRVDPGRSVGTLGIITGLPSVAAALFTLLSVSILAFADIAVPPLQARVTDLTATLASGQQVALEQKLAPLEARKGSQVAVLLVLTTQPETIEQYAIRVFDQWKLGRKGTDDGVLLLVAKNDRRLRIEVGYGLKRALSDAIARGIIDEEIVPHFKQGDFYAGISAGVERIIVAVDGESLPSFDPQQQSAPKAVEFQEKRFTLPAGQRFLERPIFYFQLEGEQGSQRLVTKGVYSDGRPFGSSVPSPVPVWSPDGTRFAYVTEDGTALKIGTLQAEGKTVFAAAAGERIFPWLAWSPNGRRLAVILNEGRPSTHSIVVIDVTDEKVRSRHSLPDFTPGLPPNKFRWSLDGRKILLSWATTLVINIETGAIQRISHLPIRAEWAPDSQAVYYFDNDDLGDFFVQKLASTSALKLIGKAQLEASGLTRHRWLLPGVLINLSPQGSCLAIAGGSTGKGVGSIHIYDLRGGVAAGFKRPFKHFDTGDVITSLEWSPDENSLAVVALAKDVKVKHLDLRTGAWTTLATVALPLRVPEIDVLGLIKTLSWTQ